MSQDLDHFLRLATSKLLHTPQIREGGSSYGPVSLCADGEVLAGVVPLVKPDSVMTLYSYGPTSLWPYIVLAGVVPLVEID